MASQKQNSPSTHLTRIGRGYLPPATRLISDSISPWITATNAQGQPSVRFTYPLWDESEALEVVDDTMASAAHGQGRKVSTVDMELTLGAGDVKEHRRKYMVTQLRVQELGGRAAVMRRGARLTSYSVRLAREARIAGTFFNTATYPSSDYFISLATAADKFTDKLKSDPKGVFQDGRKQVSDMSGQEPNVIIIPHREAMVLAEHPYILDIIRRDFKGFNSDAFRAGPTEGLPPVIQELEVIVPRGVYKSSKRNITEARSDIWSGGIWLGYINTAPTPVEDEASFMYSFYTRRIETFEGRETDGSEDEFVVSAGFYDEVVVGSRMGYFIQNPI